MESNLHDMQFTFYKKESRKCPATMRTPKKSCVLLSTILYTQKHSLLFWSPHAAILCCHTVNNNEKHSIIALEAVQEQEQKILQNLLFSTMRHPSILYSSLCAIPLQECSYPRNELSTNSINKLNIMKPGYARNRDTDTVHPLLPFPNTSSSCTHLRASSSFPPFQSQSSPTSIQQQQQQPPPFRHDRTSYSGKVIFHPPFLSVLG